VATAAPVTAQQGTVLAVAGATHTPYAVGFLLTAPAISCVNFVLSGDNSVLIAIHDLTARRQAPGARDCWGARHSG
jgi:hypothetical protein